ncbi:hypothetical protein F2Q68_00037026 [Brassica cretica]|uniref:SHSP domain-containing protein n=1 Tax=Brassica cretica TaxID=69181 RepID=A0A8S9H941_BRACR|nr:hypothetical protein F2Q68_00037026 [Brassica cretica]
MLMGAEGFYALNNPFQTNGPKWFSERKWLDIDVPDMYLRLDLPGVGPDPGDVDISVDDSKKVLTIKALAPSLNINDSSPRSYETYVRLDCHCCEISSVVDNPQVTHGVLRLLISTTPINIGGSPDDDIHSRLLLLDPDDPEPELSGQIVEPHPGLSEGPASAYEYKQLLGGSVYVRLDMPGVSDVDINVNTVNRRVDVVGEAPTVSHDSGGRSYSAVAAHLGLGALINPPRVEHNVENGVVRLFIHPA